MSEEEETQTRKILEKLSRMGFSKSELTKIEESFETPVFMEKLKDPEFSAQLLESFETPVFRESYLKDPLLAISKLDRNKIKRKHGLQD